MRWLAALENTATPAEASSDSMPPAMSDGRPENATLELRAISLTSMAEILISRLSSVNSWSLIFSASRSFFPSERSDA